MTEVGVAGDWGGVALDDVFQSRNYNTTDIITNTNNINILIINNNIITNKNIKI